MCHWGIENKKENYLENSNVFQWKLPMLSGRLFPFGIFGSWNARYLSCSYLVTWKPISSFSVTCFSIFCSEFEGCWSSHQTRPQSRRSSIDDLFFFPLFWLFLVAVMDDGSRITSQEKPRPLRIEFEAQSKRPCEQKKLNKTTFSTWGQSSCCSSRSLRLARKKKRNENVDCNNLHFQVNFKWINST